MYPTRNLTARVYAVHWDIVARAAKRAGKSRSEYVGETVVSMAALDLGEKVPPLPKSSRERHKQQIEEAAEVVGMTGRQFERHAADIVSAELLGLEPKPRVETERQRNVARAGKTIGMTPRKFERHAADIVSAKVLGLPTPDEARAPGEASTLPKAKALGGLSEQEAAARKALDNALTLAPTRPVRTGERKLRRTPQAGFAKGLPITTGLARRRTGSK